MHYNSSGYIYELIYEGTWSLFSPGNNYLGYVTDNLKAAEEAEAMSEQGVFCWNNKLTASAVSLIGLVSLTCDCYNNFQVMLSGLCSAIQNTFFCGKETSKLSHCWETNIQHKHTIGLHQSVGMIKTTLVQIEIIYGSMVAGPDKFDNFLDDRKVRVRRATIASNAGLAVALVALHDLPQKSSDSNGTQLGIYLLGTESTAGYDRVEGRSEGKLTSSHTEDVFSRNAARSSTQTLTTSP
ncbi:hypothetical protein SADUNF_Sadunf02G0059500 [Salix dunnii]|uniref:Uncharacterized protein n=1 Tax=Salix dunnii TaxID=1413687 RepID=A0A835N6I8_9ROSI|nr:hypothetical protein SADUNF_Sadunf02G0059500 [Salix dunnii]